MQPFVQAVFLLYVPVPIPVGGSSGGVDTLAIAFTPAVKAALLVGIAQALSIDTSGIFIASITTYSYRRRRSLYLPPSAGTGVSVTTGILASAAASSPLVRATLGSGAADVSSVMTATVAVVQSQMASGAIAAAVAAQPVIVTGLGYSSSAQLVAQLALDGTPIARAPPALAAPPNPGGGGAIGATIGAILAVLFLSVGGIAGYHFVFAPWRARTLARTSLLKECAWQHARPQTQPHPQSLLPAAVVAPEGAPPGDAHIGLAKVDGNHTATVVDLPTSLQTQAQAEVQAQVQAQGEALASAEAHLRARAQEVALARERLETQERAQSQARVQVLAQAQGLAYDVALQSAVLAVASAAAALPQPEASAPAMTLPGQVVNNSAANEEQGTGGFVGPSAALLRSGLSDLDFVLNADVSQFLDAHGLVDVLGCRTSRAPLLVASLAEVCAADGRRFAPPATRRLALLGFVASRPAENREEGEVIEDVPTKVVT